MHNETPTTANAQDIVQAYIDAFQARELVRCVDMYDDNATLEFGRATYQGKKALEEWHKARFAANLQLVRIDDISADGDTVTIQGVITSNRLKTFRIGEIVGKVTFQLRDGKINDARFDVKSWNKFFSRGPRRS